MIKHLMWFVFTSYVSRILFKHSPVRLLSNSSVVYFGYFFLLDCPTKAKNANGLHTEHCEDFKTHQIYYLKLIFSVALITY